MHANGHEHETSRKEAKALKEYKSRIAAKKRKDRKNETRMADKITVSATVLTFVAFVILL